MPTAEKTCFVICPIGDEKTETRKRSDDLFNHIITPIAKELKLKPERADKIGLPGDITVQIISKLYESELVVADLTDQNANVFYELAIRHALRKPIVHMIKKGQKIPFDLQQYRTIKYDTSDYDMLEPVKSEFLQQARNQLENKEDISNPYTEALSFVKLNESANPTEKIVSSLVSQVENLTEEVRVLHNSASMSNESNQIEELAYSQYARNMFAILSNEREKLLRKNKLTKEEEDRLANIGSQLKEIYRQLRDPHR